MAVVWKQSTAFIIITEWERINYRSLPTWQVIRMYLNIRFQSQKTFLLK